MLDGSWLMAQGSWLMAKGGQGRLMAHGQGPARPRGPRGRRGRARTWGLALGSGEHLGVKMKGVFSNPFFVDFIDDLITDYFLIFEFLVQATPPPTHLPKLMLNMRFLWHGLGEPSARCTSRC